MSTDCCNFFFFRGGGELTNATEFTSDDEVEGDEEDEVELRRRSLVGPLRKLSSEKARSGTVRFGSVSTNRKKLKVDPYMVLLYSSYFQL